MERLNCSWTRREHEGPEGNDDEGARGTARGYSEDENEDGGGGGGGGDEAKRPGEEREEPLEIRLLHRATGGRSPRPLLPSPT